MKCKNCGAEIKNHETVCSYCGSSVSDKQRIYVDRPVHVYDEPPEPDGLEARNARESSLRLATFSLVFAALSFVIRFYGLPVLFAIISMVFSGAAFSLCKKTRIKPSPFISFSLILAVVSIIITAVVFVMEFLK